MEKVEIELKQEIYEMLYAYANLRKMPVEAVIRALVEKFAPITHTMIVEEMKTGYEESGELNLDWANL